MKLSLSLVLLVVLLACSKPAQKPVPPPPPPPPPVISDTTPPTLKLDQPSGLTVALQGFKVSGSASDAGGVSKVEYSHNQGPKQVAKGTTAFSFDLMLSEGENTIKVFATDTAGNQASLTLSITYSPLALSAQYPSGSHWVIAPGADALYMLKLNRASAIDSLQFTGDLVGTNPDQLRISYRPDLSSNDTLAVVLVGGAALAPGDSSFNVQAQIASQTVATTNVGLRVVACASGCGGGQ